MILRKPKLRKHSFTNIWLGKYFTRISVGPYVQLLIDTFYRFFEACLVWLQSDMLDGLTLSTLGTLPASFNPSLLNMCLDKTKVRVPEFIMAERNNNVQCLYASRTVCHSTTISEPNYTVSYVYASLGSCCLGIT